MSYHAIGTEDRPLRVAIVGSGPSGFYAAESLARHDTVVDVDMFDRLPAPYGLVRYGVAPDHQKMKKVVNTYRKTAERARFRYFGNVELGRDVLVEDLLRLYDQVIYAVGAETDRRLGIPGEDLQGSHGATAFVGWYNGHPDYLDHEFDLSQERVLVVGVGNVAMDVARILLRDPSELEATDISRPALAALKRSRVREVVLLGRRGPAQAAFTPKEIRELGELDGVDLLVDPDDLELSEEDMNALEPGSNDAKNVEYLREAASPSVESSSKSVQLRFLTSPIELLGDNGRLVGVRVERNRLEPNDWGGLSARGTGVTDEFSVGLAFRSIGYRGVPVPGVPFDDRRGIIPNDEGRVLEAPDGESRPREYVVGWAKRGPTGLIGTNRGCSADTVARMLDDLPKTSEWPPLAAPDAIVELLESRNVTFVSFSEWLTLDQLESERGEELGCIREKFLRTKDALAALGKTGPSRSEVT